MAARTLRRPTSEERVFEAPATVGGLAFARKGLRLAIAHYNGATLWFPGAQAAPETLAWKGSHLGVAFSPTGDFSSPQCRNRPSMVGACPMGRTCACRAMAPACARLTGVREGNGWRRQGRRNSCCGRLQARMARWEKCPVCAHPPRRRLRPSHAIRSRKWSQWDMATDWCFWGALTTG